MRESESMFKYISPTLVGVNVNGATCYGDATVARYTLKGKDTDFNPYGCLDVECWVGILTDSAAHIQYNILCVKVSKKQLICEQSQ